MTPEVLFFVYAENGQPSVSQPAADGYEPGVKLNLFGVQSMFRPLFVPCQFTFYIATTIRGVDFAQDHRLRLVFRRDDRIIVDGGEAVLQKPDKKAVLPLDERQYMFHAAFTNVVIEDEGWYQTDLFFDGELLGSYPVAFRKAVKNHD